MGNLLLDSVSWLHRKPARQAANFLLGLVTLGISGALALAALVALAFADSPNANTTPPTVVLIISSIAAVLALVLLCFSFSSSLPLRTDGILSLLALIMGAACWYTYTAAPAIAGGLFVAAFACAAIAFLVELVVLGCVIYRLIKRTRMPKQ